MGKVSAEMEKAPQCFHKADKFSFYLQRRTKTVGGSSLSDDLQGETFVCTGTDGGREDHCNRFPCGKGSGRRTGRKDFLPDGQDDHENRCGTGFFCVAGTGAAVEKSDIDGKRKNLFL